MTDRALAFAPIETVSLVLLPPPWPTLDAPHAALWLTSYQPDALALAGAAIEEAQSELQSRASREALALALADVAAIGQVAGRVLASGEPVELCQDEKERDADRCTDLARLARIPAQHLSPASPFRALLREELARLEGDDEEESAAA